MSACQPALAAARETLDTPMHERGYLIAALANHSRSRSDCRPKPECDCYPGGFTGDTYEGPPRALPCARRALHLIHHRPAPTDPPRRAGWWSPSKDRSPARW